MKKSVRRFLYNILVVFMAVLMASMTAVQVFAAGRNKDKKTERDIATGKLYVKDVIIVNESEKINLSTTAAYQDYVVLSEPIKTFDAGSGHEILYFAVKTTENPNEAITDIKAMNMNGDYSYDAYREYLGEVEKWATKKADTTMTALKEFQANWLKGTPSAVFAYNMMNYLVGDNEDVPLGDFFVSDEYAKSHSIQVKNIVMKANLNTLTYFRQLLLVGCSETSTDGSFVEKLEKYTEGNDLIPDESNKKYNTAAEDLMNSMGTTRDTINAYRKAESEHGDGLDDYLTETQENLNKIISDEDKFGTDEYTKAEEDLAEVKKIIAGQVLTLQFHDIYYTNNDGKRYSLLDILAMDPNAEKEEDRLTADMLLPVVALMSDGQRALCGCGFDKLVGSVMNDYSAKDSEENGMLESITEFWQTISKEGLISVYAGVDLSLYDPNGIAMVGKSGEFLKKADETVGAFGVSDLAAGFMLGGSVVGIAGSVAAYKTSMRWLDIDQAPFRDAQPRIAELEAKIAKYNELKRIDTNMYNKTIYNAGGERTSWGRYNIKEKFRALNEYNTGIQDAQTELDELNELADPSTATQLMKAFSYFMIVLSVALLIFSIVTFIMNAIERAKPGEYLQVPRVLVTSIEKEEYDERQQKTTSTQMIFYKGITDPFMSDEKAKTNVSPSKVQDLLDWSLDTHDREWIAVYTTKDGRVGNPIIFDGTGNTFLTLIEKDGKTYSTLEGEKQFNSRVNIFNKDSYTVCGNGVIIFNRDLDATSTTKTGLGASMNISNGYFILFILVAVMAGAGAGVGVTCLVNKSRKKKLAVSQS